MNEYERFTEIFIDPDTVSFQHIHDLYAKSDYGKKLFQNVRYRGFKPEEITNQEWEKKLGVDVNNGKHLYLSLNLTHIFLKICDNPSEDWPFSLTEENSFTKEEKVLLLFTALVHDWAEAVVGDKPAPKKTKEDETKEMEILKDIIKELLYSGGKLTRGKHSRKNTSEENKQFTYLSQNVHNILTDIKSKLGKALNAIEKVGYVRTGTRAWIQSKRTEGTLKESLKNLALEVIPYSINSLIDYAKIYPPVYTFLTGNKHHLIEILEASGEKNQSSLDRLLNLFDT